MRLKGTFSDNGVRILEKGFLPTLERFGKTVQLLFTPQQVSLIQTSANTDGVHLAARLDKEVLFANNDYRCESKHHNKIAVQVDLSLLIRVLRGAAAIAADVVIMALTETVIPTGGNVPIKRPCLNIVSRGSSLHISQNVPLIGRPFTRDLVDALVLEAESDELCPFYLDLQPHFMRMLAVTKKAKAMDSTLSLLITQAGELHLQVLGPSVYLGCEFRPLKVFQTTGEEGNHPLQGCEAFPPAQAAGKWMLLPDSLCSREWDALMQTAETAERRFLAAQGSDSAAHVMLLLKQFDRALTATQLTCPQRVLCGIAENNGYLQLMMVYSDPHSDGSPDPSITMNFKLPVQEEDA